MKKKARKSGITGKYGTRYGSRTRKRVKDILEKMKTPQRCPKCETKVTKRESVGIWYCKKCGAKFTGGAYTQSTQPGIESKRVASRVQTTIEKLANE